MSLEQLQQNYSDATGFVVDRSVNPPKVLGQAFLVSRNRAVTCASEVFNYTEAPWALAISFVHPDVLVGIKAVVLHPDFDKKAARSWYLNQTGNPGEQLVVSNDIATLTLDNMLVDMQPDKVAELNRALSLPFNSSGVDASGNIRGAEFLSILQGVLQANKQGLLTLMDSRNIPIARLQIGPGAIQKVYYKGLLGELAFFELIYRQPAQGYAFQSAGDAFNWGNVRDIAAPADALIQEANRRVAELPSMFKALGGQDARYQQRVENYEASMASEDIRWFAERLWACIDGYMTLDKMSERAGVDTYTVLQAIREMVNKAHISLINRSTPFHGSGQEGQPLVSHTDFEVNAWDPLQAFYLDPLSGRPVWLQGNFFGVANALQPKNMLHTINIPGIVPGALILKDYKLIGIHSGPHTPKPGQPLPPVKVFQMMWMGALLEVTAKKGAGEQSATGPQSTMAGLRNKALNDIDEKAPAPPDNLEKFVCPNCYTTNTQTGPCFNCGTQINAAEEGDEVKTPAAAAAANAALDKISKQTGVSKNQVILFAGGLVAILIICLSMFGGGGNSGPVTPTKSATEEHANSSKAMDLATKYAGFKSTTPPGYWFEDTSDITKPAVSFGIYSQQANQKLMFLIMDDMSPVQDLSSFVGLPPYVPVLRCERATDVKVDEGNQIIGDGYLHWFYGRYQKEKLAKKDEDPNMLVLVGGYPSPEKGKSILLVGRAMNEDIPYDRQAALFLVDQMASDYTANANRIKVAQGKPVVANTGTTTDATTTTGQKAEDKPLATDKELDAFAKSAQEQIQDKLKIPDDVQEELKRKHPMPLKATLNVGISDDDGSVTKLELTKQAQMDSLNQALEKAVNSAAPFKDPPRTKDGTIGILVSINKDQLKVELP
jgi:hypothetical protein